MVIWDSRAGSLLRLSPHPGTLNWAQVTWCVVPITLFLAGLSRRCLSGHMYWCSCNQCSINHSGEIIPIVCSTVCSGEDHRKYRYSSLAFERGTHRWPVDSTHKRPVTRKYFHMMTSSYKQTVNIKKIRMSRNVHHMFPWIKKFIIYSFPHYWQFVRESASPYWFVLTKSQWCVAIDIGCGRGRCDVWNA